MSYVKNGNLIVFQSGVNFNKVYAHRGDIFICEGLFKPEKRATKDDHILTKPNRPVLIVSDDKYNKDIVKVLPLSTSPGNGDATTSISGSRCIQIPSSDSKSGVTYIDVSQEFTVNVHQLKNKIADVSQEIVDIAVAMNLLQKVNKKSINTIVDVLKENFPNSDCFNVNKDQCCYTVIDNLQSPCTDFYVAVERVEPRNKQPKTDYPPHSTLEDVEKLYQEWVSCGTDMFRYRYGLTIKQYKYLRDKCIPVLIKGVVGFNRHDWR